MMENFKQIIKQSSRKYFEEFVEIRRHLHKHPELSFKEFETAKYISAKLTEYGVKHETGIAKTGLVAIIEGQNPEKKVIALRADMDALPIVEESNVNYISVNQGVMHACGHDVHMTCLLGAAKILNENKDKFDGTVKLIFQPSEENFPGGASVMIKEGVLEKPKVEAITGQHVLPTLEVGKVGMKTGMYMASTDEIYLTVKGKGGHGATPELNVDTVLMASHIIVALQQIVSRNARPDIPSVLSFGRIIGEGRTNIIPDIVKVDGTFRTFNEVWRAEAHEKITNIAQHTAKSMGGECEVFIDKGYPFLVNDKDLTEQSFKWAQEFLGEENVVALDMRMTAEDFAYFSQKVPGCFYRLGVMNKEKGIDSNLHTSTFDVDEKAIETGVGLMTWLALKQLLAD